MRLIFESGILLFLFNSVKLESDELESSVSNAQSPYCSLSEEEFYSSADTTITSYWDRFFEFLIRKNKLIRQPIETEKVTFCYEDRTSNEKYRLMSQENIQCERKVSLLNLFKEIKIFNITLYVFYDPYFEMKGDVDRNIKYLIKGVQEIYDSYDMINEIGLIKFFVVDTIRINLPIEDVIYVQYYSSILKRYTDSFGMKIPTRVLQIWLTTARIYDKKAIHSSPFNRLEGIARTKSLCTENAMLLVNCNSLAKAIITLAHEISHVLGADHDVEYKKCENFDSEAFIMSTNYSPTRNSLSALTRSIILEFLKDILQYDSDCLGKVDKYFFTYEDVKHLKPLTLDEQCQDSASKKFRSNQPSMSDTKYCQRLHCKNGLIELSNYPVLNGTPCSKRFNMVCCFGRCMINCTAGYML